MYTVVKYLKSGQHIYMLDISQIDEERREKLNELKTRRKVQMFWPPVTREITVNTTNRRVPTSTGERLLRASVADQGLLQENYTHIFIVGGF